MKYVPIVAAVKVSNEAIVQVMTLLCYVKVMLWQSRELPDPAGPLSAGITQSGTCMIIKQAKFSCNTTRLELAKFSIRYTANFVHTQDMVHSTQLTLSPVTFLLGSLSSEQTEAAWRAQGHTSNRSLWSSRCRQVYADRSSRETAHGEGIESRSTGACHK